MNTYQIDTVIQINANFYDVGLNQLLDPTVIGLFLLDPLGNEVVVDPKTIVRTGTGQYYYNFIPSSPGCWAYTWRATGAVVATSREERFFVQGSEIIA